MYVLAGKSSGDLFNDFIAISHKMLVVSAIMMLMVLRQK